MDKLHNLSKFSTLDYLKKMSCNTSFNNPYQSSLSLLVKQIQTVVRHEYPEQSVDRNVLPINLECDYNDAMDEYKIKELGYYSDLDDIEKKIKKGKYPKFIYIGDENSNVCFVPLNNKVDQIKELQEQDKK